MTTQAPHSTVRVPALVVTGDRDAVAPPWW
jgi:hypothetical protein